MKTKLLSLLVLTVTLALTGCATVQIDPTTASRATVIPAGFAVSNVRPSVQLATLENSVDQMGSKFNVQTGKIFRQVFSGTENAPCSLDVISSNLSQHMSDFMILATSTQITFTASVVLTMPGGRKQTFNATGTASTAWTIDRAIREAVELAVVDLGKQIKTVL